MGTFTLKFFLSSRYSLGALLWLLNRLQGGRQGSVNLPLPLALLLLTSNFIPTLILNLSPPPSSRSLSLSPPPDLTASGLLAIPGYSNSLCDSVFYYLLPVVLQTGLSALHVAAQYGQIEVVREMLLKVSGTIKSESPSMVDNGDKGQRSDVSYYIRITDIVTFPFKGFSNCCWMFEKYA